MSNLPSRILRFVVFTLFVPNILGANTGSVLPLKATAFGTSYNVDLQFGGQKLPMRLDTGSADLWVFNSDWKCYYGSATLNATPVSRAKCGASNQTYHQTSTFQPIDSAWLGETYGAGNISGPAAYEDVQIGSISISQQEMGFVNASSIGSQGASIGGDGYSSGIFGLAYRLIDAMHPSNLSAATPSQFLLHRIAYPTVMTRLLDMNITYFSMALERTPLNQALGFGGYLSFGSLPPVAHGAFATVPVEHLKGLPSLITNGTKQLSYWALTVEAVTWDSQTSSQPFQAVVDSGNSVNFLPKGIASKVNAAFSPPAKFNSKLGVYSVECNATPPASFGIQIGGQMFDINSADMIWRNSGETCWSSVAISTESFGTEAAILGDAFLKNVVAVFDYGQNEMRFAPRSANSSNSSSTGPPPSSGGAAMNSQVHLLTLMLAIVVVIAVLH